MEPARAHEFLHRQVVGNGQGREDPVGDAVFGDVSHTRSACVTDPAFEPDAVDRDLAFARLACSGDHAKQTRAAAPSEAGKSNDVSCANLQIADLQPVISDEVADLRTWCSDV